MRGVAVTYILDNPPRAVPVDVTEEYQALEHPAYTGDTTHETIRSEEHEYYLGISILGLIRNTATLHCVAHTRREGGQVGACARDERNTHHPSQTYTS